MLVMGTLCKTPELAQRVPHGLSLSMPLGKDLGHLHGHTWLGEPTWLRAWAQCSSSMSSTQSWWLDIISRH